MVVESLRSLMADNLNNRLYEFKELSYKFWKNLGLAYYAEEEMEYITNELLCVSDVEVKKYADACSELYIMYERAAQHVIDNNLWEELGIPENAIEIIRYTWARRKQTPQLYGRFDLAGVIDGTPAKLIEFNADTATVMPETAIIQFEQLKAANIKGSFQYSELVERIGKRFAEIKALHQNREPKILLSGLGHLEDHLNLDIITSAAQKAKFDTQQLDLEHVVFSAEDGIFARVGEDEYIQYDFWFKLIPWEFIAYEEPELMDLLSQIVTKDLAIILNPAYTMIFQSKAIMKILWDLYPNHHLLLKTTFSADDFRNQAHVQKVIFGREGENVKVFGTGANIREENEGDYEDFPSVFQTFVELPKDADEEIYQAGIYFTDKAVSLSYRRRDGLIVDSDSEFIGHYVL